MDKDKVCPKCEAELECIKVDDIIVWYCPNCSHEE